MEKGRAYRRWKNISKYISRLKENVHRWLVYDPSQNRRSPYRNAKDWKDLDENSKFVKVLKKTVTRYTDPYDKIERHKGIKKARREGKKIIDVELSTLDKKKLLEHK